MKKTICYLATSAGDWGGASRYLFVTLKKLDRTRFEPLVLFPSEGPIFEQLDQMGIRHAVWPEHEPDGLLGYGANILRAMAFFKKHRVDLLHINHVGYWRPAEILAARWLRIPVITHLHVAIDKPPPFLKYSSRVVANSRFTAEHSRTGEVPVSVTYCPVDLERYDAAQDIRAELGIAPDDIVVSFIGQIRRIKGIEQFIEMAKRIGHPRARFLIVGRCRDPKRFKGAYTEEELRAAIAGEPRISYLGYRSDVENTYRASDIILMPSLWDEPFGLINIEAGASRKPIIATRSGGIPEIIRHGENGFLVDKDDVDALVEHTTALMNDAQLRARMGETARTMVEQQFADRPVRLLEAVYDELTDH